MSEHDWKREQGWGEDFEAAMAPYAAKGLEPVRVSLVYRKQLRVLSSRGELWARTGGKLMHHAQSASELPAVGDWVAARMPTGEGEALVHAVLPRRSAFVRKVPGHHAAPHVLATNLDSVLVVMGLDQDFSPRRLERFLTLAWESKATPVVVLNKKDLCPDLEEKLAVVRAIGRDAQVFAVSALTGEGLEPLHAFIGPGKSVVLLGSSGVGKSTLVNRLVGAEVMGTGDTRDDGKGRHTTTRRELLVLPGGGALIDTPGLREVQLWNADDGLSKTFDEIEKLSEQCRFGDCRHQAEPGCAVKAALDDGTLPEARYDNWRQLQRELEWLDAPTRSGPDTRRRARVGQSTKYKKK